MAVVFSPGLVFASFLVFGWLLKPDCSSSDSWCYEHSRVNARHQVRCVLYPSFELFFRRCWWIDTCTATCTYSRDILRPVEGQHCAEFNACINNRQRVDQLIVHRLSPSLFNVPMSLLWCRPRHSLPFRPRPYASARVVLCSLLLLLASGDVDPNPGPSHAVRMLHVGTYNICSAPGKFGSIHDILSEFDLDILALCETCIKHDDPPELSCVTLHWTSTSTVLFTCTEVRSAIDLQGRTSPAVTLVNIYQLQQTSTSDSPTSCLTF